MNGRVAIEHDLRFKRLVDVLVAAPGSLDAAIRREASRGGRLPPALQAWVDKVGECGRALEPADVQAVRRAGYSLDQIFEITVAAALGAARARLDAGLRALEEASP